MEYGKCRPGKAGTPHTSGMSLSDMSLSESSIAHTVHLCICYVEENSHSDSLVTLSCLVLNAFCEVFRKCISLMLP